jgi:hypothetical protein
MTEPTKLPEALRLAAVPICERSISWQSDATIELRRLHAIEQATADLRADREALVKANVELLGRIQKAEAERDEARAELARLTTLRPIASLPPNTQCLRWTQSRTGQHWMLVDKHDWHDFWTPLPPVKEADHD